MRSPTLCLILAFLTCSMVCAQPATQTPPLGTTAPAFSLPDIQGRPHALSEYRGRITVLNFWAFWCDTWKAEMPHLTELAQAQNEQGFQIVAISVDGTRLQEFRRRHPKPLPFPVLLDVGGATSRQYGIAHVPTVIILDPQGRVRYVHSGYPGNAVVLSQIRRIGAR
ncbi:MAG: TlpA family protein disulfide reductase [Armatimonadota bacterium]|nr:TlpA family protein disulfide reductase [Armatimonadota bacterium]